MKMPWSSRLLPSPQGVILVLVFAGCAALPLVLAAVAYLLRSVAVMPGLGNASQQSAPSTGSQHGTPGNGATGIVPTSNSLQGNPTPIPAGPDTSVINAAEAAERRSVSPHPDRK